MNKTFLLLSAAALLATAFVASPAWAQKGHSGHSGHSSGGARPSGFSSGVRPASGVFTVRAAGVSVSNHHYNGAIAPYGNGYNGYRAYSNGYNAYRPYYGSYGYRPYYAHR